jgi:hypothetical protein
VGKEDACTFFGKRPADRCSYAPTRACTRNYRHAPV